MAYGFLVPQPALEPMTPALEGRFLITGPSGKFLTLKFYCRKVQTYSEIQTGMFIAMVFITIKTSNNPNVHQQLKG